MSEPLLDRYLKAIVVRALRGLNLGVPA
jgi:hypothetical protein